jgi:exopolysaccharide production protein ExoZ
MVRQWLTMPDSVRNSTSVRPPSLVSIQWLRAIAALMIVLHHANHHANLLRSSANQPETELLGFAGWWFGIHIFFVVSGFIMVHTTHDFGGTGAFGKFLWRRLVRVVPLYWIMTTIMVAALILEPNAIDLTADRLAYVIKSYLFIPVLRAAGDMRPLVGQGWTLTYEMFFYAAFALATLLPRRLGIGALTAVFVVLVVVGRRLDVSTPVLYTWTDGLLLEFLMGVTLALAYEKGFRIPGWAAVAVVIAGTIMIIVGLPGPSFVSAGVPAALIFGGAVLGPRLSDTRWTRWLTVIGDASYSLYLTHTLLVRPLRLLWTAGLGAGLPVWLFIVLVVVVSVVLAIASYRFVERPLTSYLQRRFARGGRIGETFRPGLGSASS